MQNTSVESPVSSADGGEGDDNGVAAAQFLLPQTLPPDAVPLFLSAATVSLFNLEQRCSSSVPFCTLTREELVSDLFKRAGISDFHQFKQEIHSSSQDPGAGFVLAADPEWRFGQNYVFCVTPEAGSSLLKMGNEYAVAAAFDMTGDPESSPGLRDSVNSGKPGAEGGNLETQDTGSYTYLARSGAPRSPKISPTAWSSLGSDVEINNERAAPTREKMSYMLSRRRRKFKQDVTFLPCDAPLLFTNIQSMLSPPQCVEVTQMSVGTQVTEGHVEAATQTSWRRHVSKSVEYETQCLSQEAVSAQIANCGRLLPNAESMFRRAITLNNVNNVLSNDFTSLAEDEPVVSQGNRTAALQEYQSFTDLVNSKDKCISCAAWHPTQRGVLAVSCIRRLTFEERIENGPCTRSKKSLVLIWSFHDPIHPQVILESPDDIISFAFHPQLSHLIVGGCANGQLVLWDISEYQDKMSNRKHSTESSVSGASAATAQGANAAGQGAASSGDEAKHAAIEFIKATAMSSIEHSHRAAITDVHWCATDYNNLGEPVKRYDRSYEKDLEQNSAADSNAETSVCFNQLISTGLDGSVMIWDLRFRKEVRALHQVWRPVFRTVVQATDGTFEYGVMRIQLAPGASHFYCGTEDGLVIHGNWGKGAITASSSTGSPTITNTSSSASSSSPATAAAKTGAAAATAVAATAAANSPATAAGSGTGSSNTATGASAAACGVGETLLVSTSMVHFGPVCDFARSPFFSDILLSVGGWSCHIWSDSCGVALLSSSIGKAHYTCCAWSPTRPGVFFVARSDGHLEIWDLLDHSFQASNVQAVSSVALSAICVQTYYGATKGRIAHQFVAIGDDDGTAHVLEVPRNIYRASKNETAFVRGFFNRELKRVVLGSTRRACKGSAQKGNRNVQSGGSLLANSPADRKQQGLGQTVAAEALGAQGLGALSSQQKANDGSSPNSSSMAPSSLTTSATAAGGEKGSDATGAGSLAAGSKFEISEAAYVALQREILAALARTQQGTASESNNGSMLNLSGVGTSSADSGTQGGQAAAAGVGTSDQAGGMAASATVSMAGVASGSGPGAQVS